MNKTSHCFKRKEGIKNKTIIHSSKGTYWPSGILKSGGHGEENIKELTRLEKKNKFQIHVICNNGVRLGNVNKRNNSKYKYNHVWFPKSFTRKDILKAGQFVAYGKKVKDGEKKYKNYKNIIVGIIRRKGKIVTIFP